MGRGRACALGRATGARDGVETVGCGCCEDDEDGEAGFGEGEQDGD